MSENKSWDIQPKRRAPAPAPQPVAPQQRVPQRSAQRPMQQRDMRPMPQRPAPPQQRPQPKQQQRAAQSSRREKIPQGRDREPLKNQRRRAKRRSTVILSILAVLILIGVFVCFWLPMFRIQNIKVAGPDADGVQTIAFSVISGSNHYLFPRNSIFYFPESQIRAQILQQFPDISAVAISRSSLDSIMIAGVPREAAFMWCGETYTGPATAIVATSTSSASGSATTTQSGSALYPATQTPQCYNADSQGIVFSPITDPATINAASLRLYGSLEGDMSNGSPLGGHISQSNLLPNALQFIKNIKSLGVPIVAFVIRGDEADMYSQSGTRITYVLGREEMAKNLAESAFPSLNLGDGSLEYVDLRFDGKVYFKKFGSQTQSSSPSTSKTH